MSNIVEGKGIRIYADFEQSTSPIQWQHIEDDPNDLWHSTPFQVADVRYPEQALKLVSDWLAAETPDWGETDPSE